MKTIEEQTKESAVKHYENWNKYPSNGVKEDCMDDFIAGAEWERKRDKWISVKDELPKTNKKILVSFKSRPVQIARMIADKVFVDNASCSVLKQKVRFWQPLPEPPKEIKP